MSDQENPEKERLWQAYKRGYEQGQNVENVSDVALRAARGQFERMWEHEYE